MRELTPEQTAWIAGILEGEGCISPGTAHVGRPAGDRWTIQVVMSDEDIIYRLHSLLGVGKVVGPFQPNNNPKWKPVWRLTIANQRSRS